MGGRPYRSKMACTPAMAFRLFSSLEGAGFSAGPGIAGGARRRRRRSLADHEGENAGRSRKQGPLCSGLLKSLVGALFCFACFFFLPTTKSPSPEALGSLRRSARPRAKVPRQPPATDSARGIGLVDLGTGPGKNKGGGARPRCHAGGGQLPTPELKPVPPSRPPNGHCSAKSNFWSLDFPVPCFWAPVAVAARPVSRPPAAEHPGPRDRFIFVCPSARGENMTERVIRPEAT